jgi:hypothetical protein
LKKCDISDTGIQIVKVELKEFIPLDPSPKILGILLNYLNNDPELKKLIVYIQSEEFPKIHEYVEYLKKYEELYLPVRLSSIQRAIYYSNFKIFNQLPQYIF